MRQFLDVQAARGDIGGNQHRHFSFFELSERPRACGLAFVPVDRGRGNAVLLELLGEAVRPVLGAREYQYLLPAVVRG